MRVPDRGSRLPAPVIPNGGVLSARVKQATVRGNRARNLIRVNRALIVCGASGAGKSSVAAKISQVLAATGVSSAFIDVDAIAQFGPAPRDRREGVSFYDALKCKNVGSLWLNFRDAGAHNLIVAADVGSLELRARYQRALEGCAVQVALLIAHPDHLKERLTGRPQDRFHPMTHAEDGTVRQDVLERVLAEQARLQAAGVHDFAVVNSTSPAQTAARVLELAGWLSADRPPGAMPELCRRSRPRHLTPSVFAKPARRRFCTWRTILNGAEWGEATR